MKGPKVSVIMPAYNHEKYIGEAIESVLNQSFEDFEFIIINDGSTDNSEEIVKNIKDDRIRYFYQENQGAHNAINRGIHLSLGQYISILNSDDVYHINRFEEALKILETDTSIYAVFSHIEFINGEGNSIGFKRGAEDNWWGYDLETSFRGENDIMLDLLAGNFIHTTSNLFCRKNVFDDIGYFSNLKYTHDYEFFLRLSYRYKVYIIEKPLLRYRFHSANTLSEDYAESNFETGLVLANFLMNYDLKRLFPEDQMDKTMAKFFNSINTYDADMMIMAILYFAQLYNKKNELWALLSDPKSVFKKACLDRFKKFRDVSLLKERVTWQEGQTELWWRKAEELKERVTWINSIQSSLSWMIVSSFSKKFDKILPVGSKRREWVKGFLKKFLL